jgi:Domain of unknown function (DUF4234)
LSGNPYAAPKARVDDGAAAGEPAFFAVSRLKLVVMSVVTFGLYQIYWFYKNWKAMQASGARLNAPIRAVFYPLTAYWLFRHVRERAIAAQIAPHHQAGPLAAVLFAVYALTFWLPDPWWLLGYLTILAVLPVQATVDQINRELTPEADPNVRFSGWNIFGIVVGVLILVLGLIGIFLDPQ